ncbi:hypothetical protein Caci_0146 [Catenulispora acidiphila DSM 44928]|uniref:Uncharacterized protein n=1 Tax=Catenulispora acidiphila (strain DSM 44928 / JCM 14897 / NBRC 102108 / NRRL B-24433 / ID139908) TaxID=479433 RepID=C7QHG2_CATAD|nr:hypothetical protein [Catenulispora acidiphila]ACU69101.1 hypothetical protein Caci_0146 [Catenulispora acidiphila DSM 44928]
MTELDTREDDWARGVFDRARTGRHEPHWAPDAAGAARLSKRRQTRYRATGALAVMAVAGLSATAFTALGGNVFHARDTVSPGSSGPILWPGLDLTKYLDVHESYMVAAGHQYEANRMPAVSLATTSTVLQRLDPGLKHVRTVSGHQDLDITPTPPGVTTMAVQADGIWSPNGDLSTFPPASSNFSPVTTPFGYVSIATMGPHVAQDANMENKPCGLGTLVTSTRIPAPTAWSPCVRSHQSDGSDILVTHAVNLPAGAVTVAARVFPDTSTVQVTASSVFGLQEGPAAGSSTPATPAKFDAGPPLNPVPWTDDSLAQVLTGPDVKGLP